MKNTTTLRVLVAYLKGGAGKSTTVMMLAFAWARRGYNVLVIDADAGTQGVTDWASRFYTANPEGSLPFDVVQWSPRSGLLVPFVNAQMREANPKYDVVLLDVGGEAPEVVSQAAVFADLMISPTQPTQADISRMAPTMSLVRLVNDKLPVYVSLNRVKYVGTGSAASARESLLEAGLSVLETEVEDARGKYADCWGRNPTHLYAYRDMGDELVAIVEKRRAA